MNEAEWLGCTDPRPMLQALGDKASGRRLCRFAVARCRRVSRLADLDEVAVAALTAAGGDGRGPLPRLPRPHRVSVSSLPHRVFVGQYGFDRQGPDGKFLERD